MGARGRVGEGTSARRGPRRVFSFLCCALLEGTICIPRGLPGDDLRSGVAFVLDKMIGALRNPLRAVPAAMRWSLPRTPSDDYCAARGAPRWRPTVVGGGPGEGTTRRPNLCTPRAPFFLATATAPHPKEPGPQPTATARCSPTRHEKEARAKRAYRPRPRSARPTHQKIGWEKRAPIFLSSTKATKGRKPARRGYSAARAASVELKLFTLGSLRKSINLGASIILSQ